MNDVELERLLKLLALLQVGVLEALKILESKELQGDKVDEIFEKTENYNREALDIIKNL